MLFVFAVSRRSEGADEEAVTGVCHWPGDLSSLIISSSNVMLLFVFSGV